MAFQYSRNVDARGSSFTDIRANQVNYFGRHKAGAK
jgi:hypothetical protein